MDKQSFSFNNVFDRIKNRSYKDLAKNLWLPLVIIFVLIFSDMLSKSLVENNMELGQRLILIPNFLSITYVLNEGAAFSILSGKKWFFIIVTTVTVVVVMFYLIYDCDRLTVLMKIAIALIVGGALGNLIDRIMLGKVRDFIEIIFFGYDLPLLGESFAIFNIADCGITIGAILLIIGILIGYHKKDKSEQKEITTEAGE
ncbi:MAG TPA: signal peptidase II [Clostridia bacterium]